MTNYKISPSISNAALTELFTSAWKDQFPTDYVDRLTSNTFWVCAFGEDKLIGFVKVVGDGGQHGFILETTTHPEYQRQGVGTTMLSQIASAAKELGIKWLHADFEPKLTDFYRAVGYQYTEARLLNLELNRLLINDRFSPST